MVRAAIVVAVAVLGAAVAAVVLDVVRDNPGYSFAGESTPAAVALLAAGTALLACGLASWWRRPDSRVGPLLTAAALAWFLPELNNPSVGSSLAFTAGLALPAATPAIVGHAVLAYPSRRLGSRLEHSAVALAYVALVGVLGVVPALLDDAAAHACNGCPDNLLLLADNASVAEGVRRAGLYLGSGAAALLAVLVALRLIRASAAARPLFAAGGAYLVLAAATFAVSVGHGFVANRPLELRLWLGQAAALVGIALALAWSSVRARRARASVARLVVDLAQSPPPGGLRDVLAGIVGDPGLVLAYPVGDDGRLVDARGEPVELPAGRARTTLARDGRPVAVFAYAPGRLGDEQLVDDVLAAARLALEHERLQAEVGARVAELRASRARIVEAGDTERRRLERNLHDGGQQRLVGLSLSLRLLRSQRGPSSELERAEEELRAAVGDLRELAHGIFPAVLADEGFAAAVEALAEEGRVPIRIGRLPEERFAAPVESAAYTVVAEAARAAADTLGIWAERVEGGGLAVDVETAGVDGLDVVALEDRVGALDGRLDIVHESGRVRIHAELPCGS